MSTGRKEQKENIQKELYDSENSSSTLTSIEDDNDSNDDNTKRKGSSNSKKRLRNEEGMEKDANDDNDEEEQNANTTQKGILVSSSSPFHTSVSSPGISRAHTIPEQIRLRTSEADLLDGRQAGLAIVWLAATLGPKHSFKKLSKKEVQNVNILNTCNYLKLPPRPLALRYSSSLMVGVARVHSQQYSFLYTDVHQMFVKMKRISIVEPQQAGALSSISEIRETSNLFNKDIDLPGPSIFTLSTDIQPGSTLAGLLNSRLDTITLRKENEDYFDHDDSFKKSIFGTVPNIDDMIFVEPEFNLNQTLANIGSFNDEALKNMLNKGDALQQRKMGWITGASSFGSVTVSSISAMTPEQKEQYLEMVRTGQIPPEALIDVTSPQRLSSAITMTSPTVVARMRQESMQRRMAHAVGDTTESVPDIERNVQGDISGMGNDYDLFAGIDFGGTKLQDRNIALNTEDYLATSVRTPMMGSENQPITSEPFGVTYDMNLGTEEPTSTNIKKRNKRGIKLFDPTTLIPIPIIKLWMSENHFDLDSLFEGEIPSVPITSMQAHLKRINLLRSIAQATSEGNSRVAYAVASEAVAAVTGSLDETLAEMKDTTEIDPSDIRRAYRTMNTRYALMNTEPRLINFVDKLNRIEKAEKHHVQNSFVLKEDSKPIISFDTSPLVLQVLINEMSKGNELSFISEEEKERLHDLPQGQRRKERRTSVFGLTPSSKVASSITTPEVGRGIKSRGSTFGDESMFGIDYGYDYSTENIGPTSDNLPYQDRIVHEENIEDPEILRERQERRLSEILPWRHFGEEFDRGRRRSRTISSGRSRSTSITSSSGSGSGSGSGGGEKIGEVSLGEEFNINFDKLPVNVPGKIDPDIWEFFLYARQMSEMHYFEDMSKSKDDVNIQVQLHSNISTFDRIFSKETVGKKASSLAFYNILMLSSVGLIEPKQETAYDVIQLKFLQTN